MSEGGIEWNPLSLDCACPASKDSAKGLLGINKDTDCPVNLIAPGSDYPGIPLADNGDVTIRSGSISNPIILDKLQEANYANFPTLLIKEADGTITALTPPAPDGNTYAIVAVDGGDFEWKDISTF